MNKGLNILGCYQFLCPLLLSMVAGDSITISLSLELLLLTGERVWRSEARIDPAASTPPRWEQSVPALWGLIFANSLDGLDWSESTRLEQECWISSILEIHITLQTCNNATENNIWRYYLDIGNKERSTMSISVMELSQLQARIGHQMLWGGYEKHLSCSGNLFKSLRICLECTKWIQTDGVESQHSVFRLSRITLNLSEYLWKTNSLLSNNQSVIL